MAEKTILAIDGRFEEHMLGKYGFYSGGFCSLACQGTGQQINAYAAVCLMRTGGFNREV